MRFLTRHLRSAPKRRNDTTDSGYGIHFARTAQAFIRTRPSVLSAVNMDTILRIGIVGVCDLTGSDCAD